MGVVPLKTIGRLLALGAVIGLLAGCGNLAGNISRSKTPTVKAAVHLKESINMANAHVIWAAGGFPVTANGWSLVAQTSRPGQSAGATLIDPSGHRILQQLPVDAFIAPASSSPVVVWTTSQGGLAWWHHGTQHQLPPPTGGTQWAWAVAVAPHAPLAVIEAYNRDTGTAALKAGISGYRGPIQIMNLTTGHIQGQISLPQSGNVASPLLVSSDGRRILLSNLTLWTDRGRLVTTFRTPPPTAPGLPEATYGSISPYSLVANGQVLVETMDPFRTWNFYGSKGHLLTQMDIANWFNPYGKSMAMLAVPPWSRQQIVYGAQAVLVRAGQRLGMIPISAQRYSAVRSATITAEGAIRILALSQNRHHLVLLNGHGQILASLPWKWGVYGEAFLSADGHCILIQSAGHLMVYQILPSS